MRSFEQFLAESKNGSSKPKAMEALADALRDVFQHYDLPTRTAIWKEITSPKGKELVGRLLRNPKTYMSNSEFVKLVTRHS